MTVEMTMEDPAPEPPAPPPPAPPPSPESDSRKRAWAARAVHDITLPSGMEVKIRLPDIGALVAADAVPNHLRKAVIEKLASDINEVVTRAGETGGETSARTSADEVEQAMKVGAELNDWIITTMMVEPEVTLADMAPHSETRPPEEDIEMLVKLAQRERDSDARGVRLGVLPLDRMERFRHHHKCAEDCEACRAAGRELSTRGLGSL